MASPIEDLHEFDLHIHVGTRSWPDDVETYCEVTFPGIDAEHPIHKDYVHLTTYIDDAIRDAVADIKKYMKEPKEWLEKHIKTSGSDWERLRYLEREIEEAQQGITSSQARLTRYQGDLAKQEEQARQLREKLKNIQTE